MTEALLYGGIAVILLVGLLRTAGRRTPTPPRKFIHGRIVLSPWSDDIRDRRAD
jgi:hypothetical protein